MAILNIYGLGGFGREVLAPVLAILDQIRGLPNQIIDEVRFIDSQVDADEILGIKVQRPDEMQAGDFFVVAVGDGGTRQRLELQCREMGLKPYTLKSQTTVFGVDTIIGEGGVYCDFTMVTASARIGNQFQCNIYSYVAHDCIIGDYVTFAPRVCCNGNVRIEDFAYIGTGAVIKQGTPEKPLVIGKGAIVGMGAVVTKDVPAGAVVVGNPARIRE